MDKPTLTANVIKLAWPGIVALEKKEHMKERGLASPDDGDGLALTFAVPVLPSYHDFEDEWSGDDGRSEIGGY